MKVSIAKGKLGFLLTLICLTGLGAASPSAWSQPLPPACQMGEAIAVLAISTKKHAVSTSLTPMNRPVVCKFSVDGAVVEGTPAAIKERVQKAFETLDQYIKARGKMFFKDLAQHMPYLMFAASFTEKDIEPDPQIDVILKEQFPNIDKCFNEFVLGRITNSSFGMAAVCAREGEATLKFTIITNRAYYQLWISHT